MKNLKYLFLVAALSAGFANATDNTQGGNSINGHTANENSNNNSSTNGGGGNYTNGAYTEANQTINGGNIENHGVVNTSSANTTSKNETITRIEQKSMGMVSSVGLTNSGQDMCVGSRSSSISAMGFGATHAETVKDENCERLKLARELKGMGMHAVALALLSQDDRVARALAMVDPKAYKLVTGVESPKEVAKTVEKKAKVKADKRAELLARRAELRAQLGLGTAPVKPVVKNDSCSNDMFPALCRKLK